MHGPAAGRARSVLGAQGDRAAEFAAEITAK
jgi:hypothetical protein